VNAFSIGGVTAGRDGSVTLTLALPGAGSVTGQDAAAKTSASGKAKPLITKTTKTVTGAGPLKLKLRPTSSAKKLLKKGKPVRVAVKVTFTPRGGTPASQTKSVKLRRKR
jgi:hypothetical protein